MARAKAIYPVMTPRLTDIKAAMVLATKIGSEDGAQWWHGVCSDMEGEEVTVCMVAPSLMAKATNVLDAYGLTYAQAPGSSYDLLIIKNSQITIDLPTRVKRKWNPDPDEDHNKWKMSVVAQLDELGIKYFKMEYSGAGDSGNDDQFIVTRLGTDNIWYPKNWDDPVGNHWQRQQHYHIPDSLKETISDYCWDTLVQHDCVNNEGGGGDLIFDLSNDEPRVTFSCWTFITETVNHETDEEV